VLLIDHDELEPRQAGKHRHARAQHDARAAAVRGQPAFEALRVGHAAVQRHHGARAKARRKAADKALFQLGREVDLGHHHQRLGGGVGSSISCTQRRYTSVLPLPVLPNSRKGPFLQQFGLWRFPVLR
jgi:hypothetical protein